MPFDAARTLVLHILPSANYRMRQSLGGKQWCNVPSRTLLHSCIPLLCSAELCMLRNATQRLTFRRLGSISGTEVPIITSPDNAN